LQVRGALQTIPQPPQFALSLWGSAHFGAPASTPTPASAQLMRFGAQVQVPPLHCVPAAQTFPQAPQLPWSLAVFVQTPAQSVVGATQLHAPVTQDVPPPHATPHVPQFAALVCVSTQALAQFVVGIEASGPPSSPLHAALQLPKSHT
jgi:hypothetical protein